MEYVELLQACTADLSSIARNIKMYPREDSKLESDLQRAITAAQDVDNFLLQILQETCTLQAAIENVCSEMLKIKYTFDFTRNRLRDADVKRLKNYSDKLNQLTQQMGKIHDTILQARQHLDNTKQHSYYASLYAKQQQQAEKLLDEAKDIRESPEKERLAREEELRQMEEEILQREAEKKRKRREEKRRLAKEAERAKLEPKEWHVLSYNVDLTSDELTLAIKAPGWETKKENWRVTVEDVRTSSLQLDDQEELISEIINIKSVSGKPIKCTVPMWLSCPYNNMGCNPQKEPRMKVLERTNSSQNQWTLLKNCSTATTEINGRQMTLLEVQIPSITDMSLAVVSCVKEDIIHFYEEGGTLVSSTDTNFSLTVPEGAVDERTKFGLQVLPVANSTVDDIRNDALLKSKNILVAASSIVKIKTSKNRKIKKKLEYRLAKPGLSCDKLSRPSTARSHSLTLFAETQNKEWYSVSDFVFSEDGEVLEFKLESEINSFILIRTTRACAQADGQYFIKEIIKKSNQVKSQILIHQTDGKEVHVCCVKADQLSRTKTGLKSREGSTVSDPVESAVLKLREGEKITVKFTGNVDFADGKDETFVFHSNRSTGSFDKDVVIKEQYGQTTLPEYRGLARFYIEPIDVRDGQTREPVVLCEMTVNFPKNNSGPVNTPRTAVTLRNQGPLTEQYIEDLSKAIGMRWTVVAQHLGISDLAKQRIEARNVENTHRELVKDMLLTWLKTTEAGDKRVDQLYFALGEAGRADLQRNLQKLREGSTCDPEDRKWQDTYREMTRIPKLIRNWTELARALSLTDEQIDIIKHDSKLQEREKTWEMMKLWREKFGDRATVKALLSALKRCKLAEAAQAVKKLW